MAGHARQPDALQARRPSRRRSAGRAGHTVFRAPRKIKKLVGRAIREAAELAAEATLHGAGEVLEGAGIRIFQQATSAAAKFRTVIVKEFDSVIGTNGERFLRVVLDASGRVVTAFPTKSLTSLAVGFGAGAVTALESRTADAAEAIRTRIEAASDAPEEDWLTTLLDVLLDPSETSATEDLEVATDAIVDQTIRSVVEDIEAEEGRPLDELQSAIVGDLVRSPVATPLLLEEDEDEDAGVDDQMAG